MGNFFVNNASFEGYNYLITILQNFFEKKCNSCVAYLELGLCHLYGEGLLTLGVHVTHAPHPARVYSLTIGKEY
jgi:hypothetical protein